MYTFVTFGNGLAVNIFKRDYLGELVEIAFLQGDDAEQFLSEIDSAESIDCDTDLLRGRVTNYGLTQNVMANYDI